MPESDMMEAWNDKGGKADEILALVDDEELARMVYHRMARRFGWAGRMEPPDERGDPEWMGKHGPGQ